MLRRLFFLKLLPEVLFFGWLTALLATSPAVLAQADSGRVIRVAVLHGDPQPFRVPLAVLEHAFSRLTPAARMELVSIADMNQQRALVSMANHQPSFDLFFSGFSAQREQQLLQIDVPLTMGLLGARVLVVNSDRAEWLQHAIRTPAQLKKLSVGSGIHWPDSKILLHNGFNVVQTGYDGLWKMLSSGRIDVFARGVEEAFGEVAQRAGQQPAPQISRSWLLIYPLDYFVYLGPDKQALYQELNQVLAELHQTGAIETLIRQHPNGKQALHWLTTSKARTLYLENPLLSERIRDIPADYWLPEVRR